MLNTEYKLISIPTIIISTMEETGLIDLKGQNVLKGKEIRIAAN